jgi:hypothetical protein
MERPHFTSDPFVADQEDRIMAAWTRLGHGLMLTGGLALAGLMAYTLAWDGARPRPRGGGSNGQVEVSVFLPDRADWLDFRKGVATCDRKGLIRRVHEADDEVIVETPRLRRPIRFVWRKARGIDETKTEVRRLAEQDVPPAAVVGSVNTFWTVALAEGLQEAASADRGRPGPVLLVPWATSVMTGPIHGGDGRIPLLEVYPGRTFRFCPNNRREAELLIGCLAGQPGSKPGRVVMVVDRTDPYSVDMADSFRQAIGETFPKVEIAEQDDALGFPAPGDEPDASEARWAEAVWRSARAEADRRPTWVVLPLQGEPARRLLAALRDHARRNGGGEESPLRVVCGDGIGLEILEEFAANRAFPIWGISSASNLGPGVELGPDVQVLAEIVAAVAVTLDGSSATTDLRAALAGLDVKVGEPAAVAGRSLAFDASGERRGRDLGHVLATRPGHAEVIPYEQGAGGGWRPTEPIPPASVEAWR